MSEITLTFVGNPDFFVVEIVGINPVNGSFTVVRETLTVNVPETIPNTFQGDKIRIRPLPGYSLDSIANGFPINPATGVKALNFVASGDSYLAGLTSGVFSGGSHNVEPSVSLTENEFRADFVVDPDFVEIDLVDSDNIVKQSFDTSKVVSVKQSEYGSGDRLRLKGVEGYLITSLSPMTAISPISGSTLFRFIESSGVYLGELFEFSTSLNPRIFQVEVEGSVVVASPFNRIYKVSDDELIGLGESTPIDIGTRETVNLTTFIINILSLPFKLPEEIEGIRRNILLGEFDTGVESLEVITDSVTVDLGEIVVSEIGNALDYESDYEMLFPYIETVQTINPKFVVGRTLKTEYVIDLYSGDVTVTVFNDVEETPVLAFMSSIGRNIPYRVSGGEVTTIGEINNVDRNVLSPTIRKSIPELSSGLFNNMVTLSGGINSLTGFIQFSEVEVSTTGTMAAKQAIKSMLQNGIIIK